MKPRCSAGDWIVASDGWSPDKLTHHGNLFLLGNGRMGYRGTLEEFGPEEKVGILLPGLYDRVGDSWREPVNAPNGLFTRVAVNGVWLTPREIRPAAHRQHLDLRRAVHSRATQFRMGKVEVTIRAERFLSAANLHLMAMRYVVEVQGEAEITLESGIDDRIWDLNGPHLEGFAVFERDGRVALKARTHETGNEVAVAEACVLDSSVPAESAVRNGTLRQWKFAGARTVELQKCVAIFTSLDGCDGSLEEEAIAAASSASNRGYAALRADHEAVWEERWQRADVRIEGDEEGQHALRYSIYQLLSAAPFHSEHLSIPARALSGQVYKGAVFWDTEIFMFPFFLAVFPEVARNLVRYRIHTLPGAKAKAAEYGFQGAYYPWEGQEGGYDACTLFNITDVFTGRPMRTYFRDKQIHISGDVAWAVWKYVQATGDSRLLLDGGFEVMLECARFFFSYAHRQSSGGRFVLLDVTGPDEYHERVANNAYTNYLARHIVEATIRAARLLETEHPETFASLRKDLHFEGSEEDALAVFARRMYLPSPDPQTKVIEQFDGYFRLEDCTLEDIKSRILDPAEYLGGGCGLATTTRILKQADTVLLMHLLADEFEKEVKLANWNFYEPRTEHGSSLSACIYALVAAETGRMEFAARYFLKTATIDLTGESKQYVGTLYIGGTHPAANGGAWMVAAQGFCGVRFRPDGLHINPHIPDHWRAVTLNVVYRGYVLKVSLTSDSHRIEVVSSGGNRPAQVFLGGTAHDLSENLIITTKPETQP